MIQESYLQLGWKSGMFALQGAILGNGALLEVVDRGKHNKMAGPDFVEAKVRIGDTLWAGSVEMHVKSSDWERHKHGLDSAYDGVILHVVWEDDMEILRRDSTPIPCLELKNYVSKRQLHNYLAVVESLSEIPCENYLRYMDSLTIHQMVERALIFRLERKSDRIRRFLELSDNDWNDAFFRTLFRNFGFKSNEHAFEQLADVLPLRAFDWLKDKPLSCEALLFGCGGLLGNEEAVDEYVMGLRDEFAFLQHKYGLRVLPADVWKFGRVRPQNFPYVRLAQLASIINKNSHIFSKVLEAEGADELMRLFNTNISEYWKEHFRPGERKGFRQGDLAKDAIDLIIVNTCVPIVFMYGIACGNNDYCEKALHWLECLRPERNSVVNYWKQLGVIARNCFESQGLLELKESFCNHKKCLDCRIGFKILSS
jgi:hypothetical protein